MKKYTLTLAEKNAIKQVKKIGVYQLEHLNQYVINCSGYRCFQSYNSLVAVYSIASRQLLLGCDWCYSVTTLKHLYIFIKDYCCLLGVDMVLRNSKNKKQAIIKLIKDGVIAYDPDMK